MVGSSPDPALLGVATVFYLGAHLSALIATACWLVSRHAMGSVGSGARSRWRRS